MAHETEDPMESPQWAALYPDLVQSGGLSHALQCLFQQLSADVDVAKELETSNVSPPGWAFFRKGTRKSQVASALYERCFIVDFWNLGLTYGTGSTNDLTEVARAIEIFLVQKGSTARLKSEFNWYVDKGGELVHENPAASFVTKCWQGLEEWLTSEEAAIMRELIPLVSEAAKRPQLRQLLPFTSLHRLCFSRTTAYPWVQVDCIAWPIGNGLFRITTLGETALGEGAVLGEGDAVQAADILVANLPPNCGPAIHATSETWKHSREEQ